MNILVLEELLVYGSMAQQIMLFKTGFIKILMTALVKDTLVSGPSVI
jgi:hypothetical protein